MPAQEDDWSDSDQEELSDVETSVLLGVPDGPIDIESDLIDAAVSRIGGLPAFLPSPEPPFSSSHCKSCNKPMELLVQMWCPFENSPMDRALYIWGCSGKGCQGKNGSVRAWRGLRYNEKYAAKLEQKRMRESAKTKSANGKLQTEGDRQKKIPTSNPFTIGKTVSADPPVFNMGAQIFGHVSGTGDGIDENEVEENDGEDDSDSAESEKSLLTALASVAIAETPWRTAPSYPPVYLATVGEYLPPQEKAKVPTGVQVSEDGEDETRDKGMKWTSETYENSLEMDHVFERFTKRVGYEGKQCVRYELGGTPLPFCGDQTFDILWPKGVYDGTSVPKCSLCGSGRVFECQVMPNVINVVGGSMEWGTCLVYSCEKDCGCWREEIVYVQWDD